MGERWKERERERIRVRVRGKEKEREALGIPENSIAALPIELSRIMEMFYLHIVKRALHRTLGMSEKLLIVLHFHSFK